VSSGYYQLNAEYQTVALKPSADATFHSNAVVGGSCNMWQAAFGNRTSWRLHQSATTYYEYRSAWTPGEFFNDLRVLRRVDAGVTTLEEEAINGHYSNSPVVLSLEDGVVYAFAYGTTMTLTDPSPLLIDTCSVVIETTGTGGATEWNRIDDLYYFGEDADVGGGGSSITQTWVNDRAGPEYLEWVVATSAEGYDETSTETLTGDWWLVTVEPGTGSEQPDDNFTVQLYVSTWGVANPRSAYLASATHSNVGVQLLPAQIDSDNGFYAISASQPRLRVLNAGTDKIVTVRIYVK
jgi:hypothetical protein